MPIPQFDPMTGYLPEGLHSASEAEVREVLGSLNDTRRMLFGHLHRMLEAGRRVGALRSFIDGSFVTDKERLLGEPPHDIDCVLWLPLTVEKLIKEADNDAMFIFGLHHTRKMGPLDLYPVFDEAEWCYWEGFFGADRNGAAKGLVEVLL